MPHVTQFDEADITELEAFRKAMKAEAEAQGAKLTPLPFMVKACAFALRKFPQFNVSLKGTVKPWYGRTMSISVSLSTRPMA